MLDAYDKDTLKEIKKEYDKTLKRSYLRIGNGLFDNDFPYSHRYPLYFKKAILDKLILGMPEEVYRAYKDGAGHELDEGPRGTPPKFLSIGSSSQFCYTSLEISELTPVGEGAYFFVDEGDEIHQLSFEKALPILEGELVTPPYMDAYAEGKKKDYFFECKCHEMFGVHPLRLSKKYFASPLGLIVKDIPKEYLREDKGMIEINPLAFGVSDTLFDIKQLLTHLMGIACHNPHKESVLIYYYSFPLEEDIRDERIVSIINKTKLDAITIFNSPIIQKYCQRNHISLRLYGHRNAYRYKASPNNTYRIY